MYGRRYRYVINPYMGIIAQFSNFVEDKTEKTNAFYEWAAHRQPTNNPDGLLLHSNINSYNPNPKSNSFSSVYKNLMNHSKFNLCQDIETHPGPIDHTKTIHAAYSQDNFAFFGFNAGTQCVPMSLASLIYNLDSNPIQDFNFCMPLASAI